MGLSHSLLSSKVAARPRQGCRLSNNPHVSQSSTSHALPALSRAAIFGSKLPPHNSRHTHWPLSGNQSWSAVSGHPLHVHRPGWGHLRAGAPEMRRAPPGSSAACERRIPQARSPTLRQHRGVNNIDTMLTHYVPPRCKNSPGRTDRIDDNPSHSHACMQHSQDRNCLMCEQQCMA
jgi:hypothetical protein